MTTSRDLDTLIAEKVMGWEWAGRWIIPEGGVQNSGVPPAYSTDMAAAWLVVEKLKSQWWPRDSYTDTVTGLQISFDGPDVEVRLMDQHWNTWQIESERTLSRAICIAALRIVEDV